MDRRMFLRSLGATAGALGTGALLAACGRGATGGGDGGSAAGGQAGIPEGEPTLAVLSASYETLVGTDQRLAFGILTIDNNPLERAEGVQVYLRSLDGQVVSGPHAASYAADAGEAVKGVYLVNLDLPEPGQIQLVAVVPDADGADLDHGATTLNVVRPEDSALPAPGDEAVSTPTPTFANDLGFVEVCTLEPPCGMHEVSLDEALAAGRPVVLVFATPSYCQTAVCGPAVATVDRVREQSDLADAAWIHCEIYSDEGQTVADPVTAWQLPSEPWLYAVDAQGMIAARRDGPMPEVVVRDVVGALQA